MKYDIVSFGSAVVDIYVNTNVHEKEKAISYPIGSKILIEELRYDIGGGGTNTAVAFSRLGFRTGYIGKMGDDENGKKILDMLKKEKVIFLGNIKKNSLSGCSIILDSVEHDRTILTYKGINDKILMKDIKKFDTRWLYFPSLLEQSFETQKKIAEIFVKKGAKLAFNPSEYLIKSYNLSSLLKLTYILVLNKDEAKLLSKKNSMDEIFSALYNLGPRIIVITDKNNPIICYDGTKKYSITPHKIKVVERTGAGDAFASGFVAGIIVGKPI